MSDNAIQTTRNHHLAIDMFDTHISYPESRPPLLIKLTGYRLLNVTLLSAFGMSRVVLQYKGQPVAPTTLEWVMGVVLTIGYDPHITVS
jgi:hypothetical protein